VKSISDVVSGYGHLFFVSARDGKVRRIPERITGMSYGPLSAVVVSSAPCGFRPDEQVRDLMLAAGRCFFLVGPSPTVRSTEPPTYPICQALCLQADTLEILDRKSGPYQTQCITGDHWVLVRYDREHARSVIEISRIDAAGTPTEYHLPAGAILDDSIPLVTTQDEVYAATLDGRIYRMPLTGGTLAEVPWYHADNRLKVRAMLHDGARLRLLTLTLQDERVYGLHAMNTSMPDGIQHSPIVWAGLPKTSLWVQQQLLFVYYPSSHILHSYDTAQESFIPLSSSTLPMGDDLVHLVIIQVGQWRFGIAQAKRNDGRTVFRLVPFDQHTPGTPSAIMQTTWRDPGFIYTNACTAFYDRALGSIRTMKVFEL
jgi:hypothetical protein